MDTDITITICGFLASISTAFGIVKATIGNNSKRICKLEDKIVDKENFNRAIDKFESAQQHMHDSMMEQFAKHNELHLKLAEDIGRLSNE